MKKNCQPNEISKEEQERYSLFAKRLNEEIAKQCHVISYNLHWVYREKSKKKILTS